MREKIKRIWYFIIGLNYPKKRIYECPKCGKFEVWTNVYDNSDSGSGMCKCGESQVYIN
jgi:transcription elongation factor Elf1